MPLPLILPLAFQAAGTALSFVQAAKEKRGMEEANRMAAKRMLDARRKLDFNAYEDIDINKEVYELEREQMLTLGATALQQGVEGEARGGAATAGRVNLANQQAAAKTRTAMGQDMRNVDMLIAQEDAKNRDMSMGLDLAEVQGAQKASALHQTNQNKAVTQGLQTLSSMAGTYMDLIPLYKKAKNDKTKRGGGGIAGDPFNISPSSTSYPATNEKLSSIDELGEFDNLNLQPPGFVNNGYSFGGVKPFSPFD